MMQTLVEIDMSHLSSLCNQKEGLLNAVLSKSGWTEWLERLAIRNSLSMHCTRVKFWFGFGKAAPDKNAHERTMKGKTWRNKEAQETMEEPRRRKTRGRRQATGSQGQETPWVLEESELGQDRTGNWRNHGRCQEIKSWDWVFFWPGWVFFWPVSKKALQAPNRFCQEWICFGMVWKGQLG